jgi:flavodoxin
MWKKIILTAALLSAVFFIFGQNGGRGKMGKVLVIYYSYTPEGNTEKIAKKVQELTGADLYKIELIRELPDLPYTHDRYSPFSEWAKEEQAKKNYPAVKSIPLDLSQYDCIFVGGPVWWHTTPLPLTSFLLQTDFKGKPVVPFGTCRSYPGTFLHDFPTLVKNGQVLKGELFSYVDRDTRIDEKVIQWVNGLRL